MWTSPPIPLILWILLLSTGKVSAGVPEEFQKLSRAENLARLEKCGRTLHACSSSIRARDAPWLVNFVLPSGYEDQNHVYNGIMISDRHILTNYMFFQLVNELGRSKTPPRDHDCHNAHTTIGFNMTERQWPEIKVEYEDCIDSNCTETRINTRTVKKASLIGDCIYKSRYMMVILEVNESMASTPICVQGANPSKSPSGVWGPVQSVHDIPHLLTDTSSINCNGMKSGREWFGSREGKIFCTSGARLEKKRVFGAVMLRNQKVNWNHEERWVLYGISMQDRGYFYPESYYGPYREVFYILNQICATAGICEIDSNTQNQPSARQLVLHQVRFEERSMAFGRGFLVVFGMVFMILVFKE